MVEHKPGAGGQFSWAPDDDQKLPFSPHIEEGYCPKPHGLANDLEDTVRNETDPHPCLHHTANGIKARHMSANVKIQARLTRRTL